MRKSCIAARHHTPKTPTISPGSIHFHGLPAWPITVHLLSRVSPIRIAPQLAGRPPGEPLEGSTEGGRGVVTQAAGSFFYRNPLLKNPLSSEMHPQTSQVAKRCYACS